MGDLWLPGSHLGNWIAAAIIAWGLLLAYRWIDRRSKLVGAVFAAALVCRILAGLILFTISYMGLPIARGLHGGDGFWELAPDARTYYRTALRVHDEGGTALAGTASSAGSPAYVRTLALWMRIVGVSPAAGFFLNVVLFAGLCVLLVRVWRPLNDGRHDAPCALAIGAFGLAPSLVIHGAQSLKDDLFVFLLALVCFSALRLMDRDERPAWVKDALSCMLIGVAVLLISGIRSYFGLMVWACLFAGFAAALITGGRRGIVRVLVAAVFSLGFAWVGYKASAGTDYWNPVQLALAEPMPTRAPDAAPTAPVTPAPSGAAPPAGAPATPTPVQPAQPQTPSAAPPSAASQPPASATPPEPGFFERTGFVIARMNTLAAERLRAARVGFENSGGGTKMVVERTVPGLLGEMQIMSYGLATMFVPMSLLRALGLVDFPGGRGLLFLTDIDTLIVDATILGTLFFLWRHRASARRRLPYMIFAGSLALLSAALIGYVVTNYGTLFRLRVMMAAPLWLLVLALSRRSSPAPDAG